MWFAPRPLLGSSQRANGLTAQRQSAELQAAIKARLCLAAVHSNVSYSGFRIFNELRNRIQFLLNIGFEVLMTHAVTVQPDRGLQQCAELHYS
jgi:hypothetical protein